MTRRKAELDAMTTSDLTTLMKEKLAEEIETKVREQRVGRPLLKEDDSLMNRAGNTLKFKKRGSLQATEAGETEDASFQKFTQDSGEAYENILTVEVEKFRVASELSTEMIQDGEEDAIEATEEEIANAMSDLEDIVCIGAASGGEWYEETITSTKNDLSGTATDDTVLDVGSATGDDNIFAVAYIKAGENNAFAENYDEGDFITDYEVFYDEAQIVIDEDTDNSGDTAEVGVVTINDGFVESKITDLSSGDGVLSNLNDLRTSIASNKYTPDTLVMNQSNVGQIMDTSAFTDVSQFGSDSVIRNGQVGRIYGMDVLISSQIPDEYVVALDAESQPSVLVNKEDMRVQQEPSIVSDSLKIAAYQRFGVGCLRENATRCLQLE